ncbi:TlpA family protein disulfide reductase [Natrinema sp. 1APR25-10V2]|nr:TlpA family protein disulfide reductase [Natrinema sp. 1APR25-10V2]
MRYTAVDDRTGTSMNRRALLAATAGMTALGGCLDSGSENRTDGTESQPSLPFEIATIDATGSTASTVRVPQSGRTMLLNFTRTQCPTSRAHLSTLAEAKATLEDSGYAIDGDESDAGFLSIVDGTSGPDPSDGELRAWFDENGGNWPLGRDRDGTCHEFYEISGYPTTMTIDGTGEVRWRDQSGTARSTIVTAVERALTERGSERTADGGGGNTSETLEDQPF